MTTMHIKVSQRYKTSAVNWYVGIVSISVSFIFLQTYIKWESGSSRTKSAGSNPFSERGMGSKYDFLDGVLLSGFWNPGLAARN